MHEIAFQSGEIRLGGAIWSPDSTAGAPGVVLVGGSGPADRSNGGYFEALRDRLVRGGMMVLAYDKRGVGASQGTWASAGVETLAGDLAAAVARLRCQPGVDADRIGIFGHSEGGWVALRACADGLGGRGLVLNSCPAVSFIEAEVHALAQLGVSVAAGHSLFEQLRATARSGCGPAAGRDIMAGLADPALRAALDSSGFELTDASWAQLTAWIDYDPADDLRRLDVPTLAIYGAQDPLVPVEVSQEILGRTATTVRCRIFDRADHRVFRDGRLAMGYLEAVIGWFRSHLE